MLDVGRIAARSYKVQPYRVFGFRGPHSRENAVAVGICIGMHKDR